MLTLVLTLLLQAVIGQTLPDWTPGTMDIHVINAGRGECSFMIFPDGTTMAIDAGEYVDYKGKYPNVAARPDSTVRPYQVYAGYIRHFLPKGHDRIDYFVLTHYHMDHMGRVEKQFAKDPQGHYCLSGVTALYSEIPFGKLVDRSYPDYSETVKLPSTSGNLDFYKDFVNYNVEHRSMEAEKCRVGTSEQFPLLYDSAKYPDFQVFCYASGGVVWTGDQKENIGAERENALSCSLLMSYGDFDYFTSGDSNETGIVSIVAASISRKVDAMKCTHHMSNPLPVSVEMTAFRPQAVLTTSFYVRKDQPQQSLIQKYGDKADLFFTNIDPSLVASAPEIYSKCAGIGGHFVIRIEKGGKSFMIYHLDDTDFSYRVKAVSGPYQSR